ncbi:MAG: ATP synthase F1 subunit gamma [Candidatus Fournierella pullistercoris]|uniref:ATP synthase gamma chain n=1 Tax=Candidatus Allofournierella pullistercoris TaxID=2838597 RepID=A0A948T2F1_9FIRM|nr:ATP synthase F1 subunit gamma [Candidatus Fournierella pullistercoris]
MASIKEIRTRINSVDQTLKITNAMYLISSSKMRKARQQLNNVFPYFQKIQETIADILHHSGRVEHPLMEQRGGHRKVGYIVVTSDKGLCSSYNHNILKLAEEKLAQTPNFRLFVIGQVGRAYFAHRGIPVQEEFLYTAQDPTVTRARDISEEVTALFLNGELDEVHMIYTHMVSPLLIRPSVYQLLPLDINQFEYSEPEYSGGRYKRRVTYVPSAHKVMDKIVPGYLKGVVFGCLVESFCSEQNARMTAMDSSTKNARDMIRRLSLEFNRARQSAITQELTEIVAGSQQKIQRFNTPDSPSIQQIYMVQADGTMEAICPDVAQTATSPLL